MEMSLLCQCKSNSLFFFSWDARLLFHLYLVTVTWRMLIKSITLSSNGENCSPQTHKVLTNVYMWRYLGTREPYRCILHKPFTPTEALIYKIVLYICFVCCDTALVLHIVSQIHDCLSNLVLCKTRDQISISRLEMCSS